jgi:hypothetical protein
MFARIHSQQCKDRLPKWMVEEMEAFRENEKREKQREKARVNQAERVQGATRPH